MSRLEIERKLGITITMPQTCHFCGEEITKFGRESESLVFHSLDGNHNNWAPLNKVPAHSGCHATFHMEGDNNPAKRPEVRKILSEQKLGDKNPMRRPEVARKNSESQKKGGKNKGKNNPMYGNAEAAKRGWIKRKERLGPSGGQDKVHQIRKQRYGPSGVKDPVKHSEIMSKANQLSASKKWRTRRERYGPTGRKPRVIG